MPSQRASAIPSADGTQIAAYRWEPPGPLVGAVGPARARHGRARPPL